jgi:hypothetical protein
MNTSNLTKKNAFLNSCALILAAILMSSSANAFYSSNEKSRVYTSTDKQCQLEIAESESLGIGSVNLGGYSLVNVTFPDTRFEKNSELQMSLTALMEGPEAGNLENDFNTFSKTVFSQEQHSSPGVVEVRADNAFERIMYRKGQNDNNVIIIELSSGDLMRRGIKNFSKYASNVYRAYAYIEFDKKMEPISVSYSVEKEAPVPGSRGSGLAKCFFEKRNN